MVTANRIPVPEPIAPSEREKIYMYIRWKKEREWWDIKREGGDEEEIAKGTRGGREITYSLNGHRETVTVCGVGVNVMTTPTQQTTPIQQTTVRKPLT